MSEIDATAAPLPLPGLLEHCSQLGFAELHKRLREEGHPTVRPGHGCVLRYIDLEGTRLTGLAARSGFTKQAVGEAVDDLERLGYVERVPDPRDGRAKIIRLTERGADARRAGQRIFAETEAALAERFGEQRIAELRALLEEIAADSETSPADARGDFAAV